MEHTRKMLRCREGKSQPLTGLQTTSSDKTSLIRCCCMFSLTHKLSNIYKLSFTCNVQRLVYNCCLFVYFLLVMVLFYLLDLRLLKNPRAHSNFTVVKANCIIIYELFRTTCRRGSCIYDPFRTTCGHPFWGRLYKYISIQIYVLLSKQITFNGFVAIYLGNLTAQD